MPGFFKRFANRLWRAEQHTKALGDTLNSLLQHVFERDEQDKEMINIHMPLLQNLPDGPYVEFSFFRRSVLQSNPDLSKLFAGPWKEYLKDYNVAASLPQPSGQKRDLYYLAAFDAPWDQLDTKALRQGVIHGIAVDFNEDLETAIRRVAGRMR